MCVKNYTEHLWKYRFLVATLREILSMSGVGLWYTWRILMVLVHWPRLLLWVFSRRREWWFWKQRKISRSGDGRAEGKTRKWTGAGLSSVRISKYTKSSTNISVNTRRWKFCLFCGGPPNGISPTCSHFTHLYACLD